MSFHYQPLQQTHIRVLKPQRDPEDGLCFQITHSALAKSSGYCALSYTWGPPSGEDAPNILIDGQKVAVRQNLYEALQQIQQTGLIRDSIWVDAICINQADDQERSHQVTLMKEIYQQAKRVIVWLGKPADEINNKLAIKMMRHCMHRIVSVKRSTRSNRKQRRTWGQDHADLQARIDPATDKSIIDIPGSEAYKAWEGVLSIWESSWWTRTWIFQEATVPEALNYTSTGKRVIFLCGDQTFFWSHASATRIVSGIIERSVGLASPLYPNCSEQYLRLQNVRDRRNMLFGTSFLDMLQLFRHTQCHDPRDKVYAPLCLAHEDVRRKVVPDYATKTVLDTYLDVVDYCLAQPGHQLDFLAYARYEEDRQTVYTPEGRSSTVPSWVPNFAVYHYIWPIQKLMWVSVDATPVPVYRSLSRALSTITVRDSQQLHLKGIEIDNVKHLLFKHGSVPSSDKSRVVSTIASWISETDGTYFTGEDFSEVFKTTMALDVCYDDYFRACGRGGKNDQGFLDIPPSELSNEERQRQTKMVFAQRAAWHSRILGLSQKHYLVLMLPDLAAVGDLIWALYGGQVLYVLRPINQAMKHYRFIGECYAHGLMDGYIDQGRHSMRQNLMDIVLL